MAARAISTCSALAKLVVSISVVLLAIPLMIEGSTNPASAATARPHASTPVCAQNGDFPYGSSVVGIAATHDDGGYWIADNTGAVAACGDAPNLGEAGALNRPIVGIAATPDGGGFYLVASDGGVFTFGDAQFYGSTGNLTLNKPIVGMAVDPATGGYWLVASDGGVFAFDAPFLGSTGAMRFNKPIVGMAVANNGSGYWLVASDGGIFSFNAPFWGSAGSIVLNKPVVGMAVDLASNGYSLVASDGGIFSFNAPFDGSTGNIILNEPIVGMESNTTGSGYRFVAADGGVFDFGTSGFYGTPVFAPPPPPPPPPQPSLYPLRVSANGRYLVDRSGQPYFMAADTAWDLLSAPTVAQSEEFLRELKAQGYNSILAYMVNFNGTYTDPAGQTAFIDGHMSDPNPAYFAQVQTMVEYAATLGLEIVAGPFELDSAVGQGYTDPADWAAFGRFLGATFRNDPNLIWMLGGDHDPINYYGSDSGVDYTPDIDALASALQATDGTHLMTYHPHRNSSDFFQSSPWLSFNMIQYNRSVESPYAYQLIQGDYEKQPVKPTLLAEPAYEPNDAVGDPTSPYEVRRSAYWAVLSGALGFSFGASETNSAGGTAAEVVADVNQPGELQLSHLIDLFNSIAWSQLTPDYAHQVIGGGGSYGSTSWVSVAATSDHRTALAYDPTGSSLDVDLATFPASVQLQWFDPTNGTLSPASDRRLPNTGTVTVTPPHLNSTGDPDFVLIASVGDFEITTRR